MKPRIAIILFPGTNCEDETARAVEAAGMEAEIVKWNQELGDYDGYVLPGGWSYEDRIRAGVIASKDRIMDKIKKEAANGKPIIGICNGCQVLVESGLIPGVKLEEVQMALAPNINPKVSGFYCTWINLRTGGKKNAFNLSLEDAEVIPMPIAHGEGRFTTTEEGLLDRLIENGQVVFRYCTKEGDTKDDFPINPNGSMHNIAGVCNEMGNVLALMPHPERASWNRQLPGFEKKPISDMDATAPAIKIFESIKRYIENEG